MLLTRRALGEAGVASLVAHVIAPFQRDATTHTLSGEVLDKQDNPIPSVLVTLYRGGTKVGSVPTGTDGRYTINFRGGPPLSTVRYQQTAYLDGTVDNLVGIRGHNINKTLYLRGNALTVFEAQEALAALERVFYLEEREAFSGTREKYVAIIDELRRDVPRRLQPRVAEVRSLFSKMRV